MFLFFLYRLIIFLIRLPLWFLVNRSRGEYKKQRKSICKVGWLAMWCGGRRLCVPMIDGIACVLSVVRSRLGPALDGSRSVRPSSSTGRAPRRGFSLFYTARRCHRCLHRLRRRIATPRLPLIAHAHRDSHASLLRHCVKWVIKSWLILN